MTLNTSRILKAIVGSLLGIMCWGAAYAKAAIPTGKTTVIYFGQQSQDDFDKKVKPFFEQQSCKNCELVNYTPYTKEGTVDLTALRTKIETLPENTSFVFFDFNMKATDQTKELVELLNKKVEQGVLVVGSAGAPKANESSSPLSRTVLGQVKNALIIGELGEKDRLLPTAFYGPEMLTAIRPPRDKIGQGMSPLIFAAGLAEHWHKRGPQEWAEYLKGKKSKSRKIWLDLGDMF